eukprot:TRINITY_DN3330_c0_g1_i10.p1 TRINITY_DN3330_c0_g1~~TRINITY_DN3330_c0_g1_i10.p1  ORF type:complete len:259 (-),score=15.51 TRINITY_DN3330_c0_g1_i10:11-787(-)
MTQKEPTLKDCLGALSALFSPTTDHDLRKKANEWLIAFQRTRSAWQICDQILSRTGLPEGAYFFVANTLRTKLLYDFADLPHAAARTSFRASLLGHVLRFAAGPQTVRTRLALCVATLAVQICGDEWKDPLEDLTTKFAKPETALAFLDILAVFPEEPSNKNLCCSRDRRSLATKTINAFAPKALAILLKYLKGVGHDRDLQRKVLDCYLSWIRQGSISPEAILKDPLFNAVFDALKVEIGRAVQQECRDRSRMPSSA